ncbi:hypothetical protein [Sandaracinus amylolyticus]|uniref:DUF11 domain-containing protein n=1 Tax=Sandaracinus amylolyticus TaxID=927083 RepID=A0A0F6W1H1_9BACT|nr:hypothetical protein [Sandaracinus amylolyticus]AKF04827.1 hypothetical protein DB32_001976 [Sandaracinus amylolyticus]
MRIGLAVLSVVLASCASAPRAAVVVDSEPAPEAEPETEIATPAIEPAITTPPITTPPITTPPTTTPPSSATLVDHASTPCSADPHDARFETESQHPGSSFHIRVRSSHRADARTGEVRARPGDVVRFDVAITNAATVPLALSAYDVERLQRASVMGLSASWTMPLALANGALREGDTLAPGAMLRLCLAFDVGREPVDAAPPSAASQHVYNVDFPSFHHQGLGASGGYVGLVRRTIVVRFPRDRRPSLREPDSWGGVIALELAAGADVVAIARASGMRVGSGVRPFTPIDDDARDPRTYVEAPPHLRVRDAAAALDARDDVLRATPLLRGDPGTEGCSEFSPCARGELCCYMCGIPGCPHGCYAGRSCPHLP